jgi:hypothetical protein
LSRYEGNAFPRRSAADLPFGVFDRRFGFVGWDIYEITEVIPMNDLATRIVSFRKRFGNSGC